MQDNAISKKEGKEKKEKNCVVYTEEIQWLRHVTDQKISSRGKMEKLPQFKPVRFRQTKYLGTNGNDTEVPTTEIM